MRGQPQQVLVAAARPDDAQAQRAAAHHGNRQAHLRVFAVRSQLALRSVEWTSGMLSLNTSASTAMLAPQDLHLWQASLRCRRHKADDALPQRVDLSQRHAQPRRSGRRGRQQDRAVGA